MIRVCCPVEGKLSILGLKLTGCKGGTSCQTPIGVVRKNWGKETVAVWANASDLTKRRVPVVGRGVNYNDEVMAAVHAAAMASG